MTLTLDNKPIVIPETIRRKAGFRRGDRIEFKVSKKAITILREGDADEDPPTEHRAVLSAVAKSKQEFAAGLGRGPFATAEEFAASMKADITKLRARRRKTKSIR